MNRPKRHASLALATLRPEMPSLRRMPAPSRLPEFDLDGVEADAVATPRLRPPGLLRHVIDQLGSWTRRG